MKRRINPLVAAALLGFLFTGIAFAAGTVPAFPAIPDRAYAAATVDLATTQGVAQVGGEWRYHDARVVSVPFRAPGADGQPTGAPVETQDIAPHAGAAGYNDSQWPV